eukprot:1158012-Pelagomonas_calceolata.AAC.5
MPTPCEILYLNCAQAAGSEPLFYPFLFLRGGETRCLSSRYPLPDKPPDEVSTAILVYLNE